MNEVKVDVEVKKNPKVDVEIKKSPTLEIHAGVLGEPRLGDYYTKTETDALLDKKQDKLTAGEGIEITEDNVINCTLKPVSTAADVLYENEAYPDVENVQDALDQLLYSKPSVSLSGGGNYEIGYTKSSTSLSWSVNKKIKSQSINQGIGSLETDVRSYEYETPITSNTTFTITVSDGKNTASSSTSVSFLPKRYWGVRAKTSLLDSDILALSSELSNSRVQTRTFDCSGGKYFYFVIRSDYCNGIKFKVGGLSFSDMEVVTRNVVNSQGATQSYNIYRVNKIQTGSSIPVEVL